MSSRLERGQPYLSQRAACAPAVFRIPVGTAPRLPCERYRGSQFPQYDVRPVVFRALKSPASAADLAPPLGRPVRDPNCGALYARSRPSLWTVLDACPSCNPGLWAPPDFHNTPTESRSGDGDA